MRQHAGGDAAASDMVANILLVAVVLGLGAIVATLVAANLSHVPPAASSLSLAPVHAGDGTVRVLLQDGEPLDATSLRVLVARNGSAAAPVATWSVGGAALAPGGTLTVTLSPAVAPGESVRVLLARTDANLLVLDATSVAEGSSSALPPSNLTLALSAPALPADGATPGVLVARVSNPVGAFAVASVRADLSALNGGASSLVLHDDGVAPDLEGGDGSWAAGFTVVPGTAQGVYRVNVTAYDASGAASGLGAINVTVGPISLSTYLGGSFSGNFTGNFTGNLHGAVLGGDAASLGTRFAVVDSANMTFLRLRNWSYDTAHLSRLQNDAIVIRIIGQGNQQWSAYIKFSLCQNSVPCVTQMETWGPSNDTVYVPRNATLPLSGLDLDLLNPVGSQQFVRSTGAADPTALYPASGVFVNPTFFIAFLGDEQNTGQVSPAQNNGLYSMDVFFQ